MVFHSIVPILCLLAGVPSTDARAWEAALPSPLTWRDAVRLFRDRGFDLLLADAAVASARGDRASASAVANPSLTGGVGRSFAYGHCPGCSALAWNVGLSDNAALSDILSGKRGLRTDTATLALAMAKQDRVDAERMLLAALGRAYVDVVFAKQALQTQREAQATLGKLTDLNRARFEHGSISEVEVLKVETERLSVDQDVDKAEEDFESSRAQLGFFLGVRQSNASFDVDGALPAFALPPFLTGADESALLARATEHRPDLVRARLAREKAEAAIRSIQRLRFPEIALSAGVSGQGSGDTAVNPPTLSVGLTLTPPLFNAYAGEIAKARAEAQAAGAAEAKLQAQILADVFSAYVQWSKSRKRVERAQAGLLDRAARTRDLVRLQYQKGAASLLEYLDAERTLIATQLSYITDLADYWRAVVLLGQAIGEDYVP
jgi:cobalt-zinc-cadmium efflux system outer membrane protein